MKNIKTILLQKLEANTQEKIDLLVENIESVKESRDMECKCTVGDKHETGRAMTQIELEKYQTQLVKLQKSLKDLTDINLEKNYVKVEFGSLVITDSANFFFAGPFGKMALDGKDYYVISLASPIGQVIKGKSQGGRISFQNKTIDILEVY